MKLHWFLQVAVLAAVVVGFDSYLFADLTIVNNGQPAATILIADKT